MVAEIASKLLHILALFPLLVTASAASAEIQPPLILVSVPPQAYVVERIAGPLARVVVLIPATANHEMYEPSLRQLQAVKDAQLFFRLGHPQYASERAWAEEIASAGSGVKIVSVADGVALMDDDIHYWLSPAAMEKVAGNVLRALAGLMPDKEAELKRGHDSLVRDIRDLNRRLSEELRPYRGRSFLVYHPAWGYFAREFGLVQHAVETHGKEPGSRAFLTISRVAAREDLRVLFTDQQTPRSIAAAIAQELRLRTVSVDPLGQDWLRNLEHFAAELRRSYEDAK